MDFAIAQALAWHRCEWRGEALKAAAILADRRPWVRARQSAMYTAMPILRPLFARFFGQPPPPRRAVDHLAHFQQIYERGAPFVRALAARFALDGAHAISIACGAGAEEIVLAQCGVTVDGVDPIEKQIALGREQAALLAPPGRLSLHACRHEAFESSRRYDLIYISGPQDWMNEDFRLLVPDAYLAALRKFAAPRALLILRFWSASYSPDVLTSAWFAKALAERLRVASDFRLREYWLSASGYRALIVCTRGHDGDLPPAGDGFAAADARFGLDATTRKYSWSVDAVVAPSWRERLTAPKLAARHRLRALRDRLITGRPNRPPKQKA